MKFYVYPKCSTCRNAKKWLETNGQVFEEIHIVENPPTAKELKEIMDFGKLDIKKLFNTSGNKYKELNLKDKLPTMTEQEKLELLASDGMLIKRPLLVTDKTVVLGFKEDLYKSTFL